MVIEVKKKDGETNESLLRRFTKKVQHSGIIIKAKKGRFREIKKNDTKLKKDAIMRQAVKKQYDYLRKTGQYDAQSDVTPPSVKRLIRIRKK